MQLWRKGQDEADLARRDIAEEELLDAYSSAVVRVVEEVSASVVQVRVRGVRRGQAAQGAGSGSILSPDGLILTNNHVVEGASAVMPPASWVAMPIPTSPCCGRKRAIACRQCA
jgi:S1-C subfamily serine protease